jgi:hypothetical protein
LHKGTTNKLNHKILAYKRVKFVQTKSGNMPKQFGTFISELAKIAGYDETKLIDLLSINAQIPDDLVNAVNASLMTMETAKNNIELKKYFHAQALNGVDAELRNALSELELDDENRTAIDSETSTYKKVSKSLKLVKELQEKKAQTNNKGEKTELQKEIDRLNNEIKTVKAQSEDKEKEFNSKLDSTLTEYQLNSILSSKNYALDGMPKDVLTLTAKNLLQSELSAKGIKIVRDNDKLKLVRVDAPDLDYRENNTPVQLGDFVDSVLANNKLLKVSEPQANTVAPQATTITGPKADNAFAAALADTARTLEAAGISKS